MRSARFAVGVAVLLLFIFTTWAHSSHYLYFMQESDPADDLRNWVNFQLYNNYSITYYIPSSDPYRTEAQTAMQNWANAIGFTANQGTGTNWHLRLETSEWGVRTMLGASRFRRVIGMRIAGPITS